MGENFSKNRDCSSSSIESSEARPRQAKGQSERERVKGYEREYSEFIPREI